MNSKELIDYEINSYNAYLGDRKIPYKNTRILWNDEINKEKQVLECTSILVVEFDLSLDKDTHIECRSSVFPSPFPTYLYKLLSKDIGNCESRWRQTTIMPITIELLYKLNFVNHDIRQNFLNRELFKIEEYRDIMAPHNKMTNSIYNFAP